MTLGECQFCGVLLYFEQEGIPVANASLLSRTKPSMDCHSGLARFGAGAAESTNPGKTTVRPLVSLGRAAKAFPPTKLNLPVITWWRGRMFVLGRSEISGEPHACQAPTSSPVG